MNKILTLTAGLLLAAAVTVSAQSKKSSADSCIIMTADGKEIKTPELKFEKGQFRYQDGKKWTSFRKKEVKWAWIPKPADVRNADKLAKDGKFVEAADAYSKAGDEYAELGWEPYCIYNQAKALKEANKAEDAIGTLEKLVNYKHINPRNERVLLEAYKMLIDEYLIKKDFDKAIPIVNNLTSSANEDIASSAFLTKGDALKAKFESSKDKEDLKSAALAYFQSALLFPKSKQRPAALLEAYHMMKMANDARAEKFAEILRKEHASSPEAKQLK